MKKTFLIFGFFILLSHASLAAVWQWSVEIESIVSDEINGYPRAFLWIPEDCERVRGVVLAGHNMTEEGILEHPHFRSEMKKLGFAEIWVTPMPEPMFDVSKGAQTAFEEIMSKLADVSGYAELTSAPVVPIGHSACATYPWNFGAWNPERTLAMLSIHGDSPRTHLTGCGRPNLDWGNRTIEGIPGLIVMGEYEWWEDRLISAFDYRKEYPAAPVSLLADAGRGHFDYSDGLVNYLALFIKKAAKYRLPSDSPSGSPVKLINVNATDGWLADRWWKDKLPRAKAAPYAKYKGDKDEAFWYFDAEIAKATESYYALAQGKEEQYISFVQDGELLGFNPESHARINARFEPGQDGLTFHLSAVYTDSLRSKIVSRHGKGEIDITRICGPVRKVNDTTFTVRYYRMGLNSPKRTGDIWLLAASDGDKEYKSAVQQLNIRIPHRNEKGQEQFIQFEELPDVKPGTTAVALNASATSGLPVYYYVKEGPAEIENNRLLFTTIPPKTAYPVKVTVVAWQYGRAGVVPEIRTADEVERTFYIYQ